MTSDEEDGLRRQLQQWVRDEGLRRDADGPAAQADLMQEGWIDSLGLMTLIAHVEDLRGRPLEEREMRLQNFVSVDSIVHNLFGGRS